MKAQECRPGGRHAARERGAFDLKPAQLPQTVPPEPPEVPAFSCVSFTFGRYAVPGFKLEDIVRWT